MFNFDYIFSYLAGIGILFAGLGTAYAQFKTGSSKEKDEVIKTLKESVQVERDKNIRLTNERTTLIDSHQAQINDLNDKIGELRGLYTAAEQSKKEYLEILQGRDPRQQKFMEIVLKTIEENQKVSPAAQAYMRDTAQILGEIKDFMFQMNQGIAKGVQFNEQVSKDTDRGEGNVLRKTPKKV